MKMALVADMILNDQIIHMMKLVTDHFRKYYWRAIPSWYVRVVTQSHKVLSFYRWTLALLTPSSQTSTFGNFLALFLVSLWQYELYTRYQLVNMLLEYFVGIVLKVLTILSILPVNIQVVSEKISDCNEHFLTSSLNWLTMPSSLAGL